MKTPDEIERIADAIQEDSPKISRKLALNLAERQLFYQTMKDRLEDTHEEEQFS